MNNKWFEKAFALWLTGVGPLIFFFLIQQMSMFDLYVGKIKHLVSWVSLKELGSVPDFMSKDLSLVACWSRLNAMQISLLWHQIINRAMLLLMLPGKKYLLLTEFKLFGRLSYLHWTWTFLLLNQPNNLFPMHSHWAWVKRSRIYFIDAWHVSIKVILLCHDARKK